MSRWQNQGIPSFVFYVLLMLAGAVMLASL